MDERGRTFLFAFIVQTAIVSRFCEAQDKIILFIIAFFLFVNLWFGNRWPKKKKNKEPKMFLCNPYRIWRNALKYVWRSHDLSLSSLCKIPWVKGSRRRSDDLTAVVPMEVLMNFKTKLRAFVCTRISQFVRRPLIY